MRKTKKVVYFSIIFVIILSMFSSVFATELNTQLDIIQKASETKYLENDQGYISKTIVDSNAETGEVTIDLSLSNISNDTQEKEEKYESTEIYIIVSENIVNETEKLNTYVSYIDTLTKKVFEKNSNTKIGIIGMKGTISDGEVDENGNMVWGENDEGTVEGTADNAEVAIKLTKSSDEIKNGLKNMNSSKKKYRTNLQAAIRLANKSYSENVNKVLISLYDGVPGIAIGVQSQITYGGAFSQYKTAEEAVKAKHEKVSNKTKTEILTLKNNNVDFILLRPDDTSYDETWYNSDTGEVILEFDGSPYVKNLYGTLENPTYGKMYSLNNDNLEKIVTEYIYQDIMEDIRVDIRSAVIKEYFSKEIVENFDITFSNESIDTTKLNDSNYIVWNIGDVQGNKTINLKYTLKIKDMKNEELLNKVISTSEKTELTYINYLDKQTTAVSTSSPKIKLSEIIEELTATVSYDPTSSTTEEVTATIKTNKKVNKVDGWTLSEDGKTLTKVYSSNATETVHLVDIDGMQKDVIVKIENIIQKQEDTQKPTTIPETQAPTITPDTGEQDNTQAPTIIPQTGESFVIILSIIAIIVISIYACIRYNKYKGI